MNCASGSIGRRRGVEPVDVGEQHQAVGADHGGDARRQPVVVAVADLGGRHRVVLVDDRHRAASSGASRASRGRSDSGAAPPCRPRVSRICAAVSPRSCRHRDPGACQRHLPHRSGRLRLLELQRPALEAEHRGARARWRRRTRREAAAPARPARRCRRQARQATSRSSRPVAASTSSAEPTFTTMRRWFGDALRAFTSCSSDACGAGLGFVLARAVADGARCRQSSTSSTPSPGRGRDARAAACRQPSRTASLALRAALGVATSARESATISGFSVEPMAIGLELAADRAYRRRAGSSPAASTRCSSALQRSTWPRKRSPIPAPFMRAFDQARDVGEHELAAPCA